MKITIYGIILLMLFLFLAKTTISFKPFHIECKSVYAAAGWLLMVIGAVLIQTQGRLDGFKDAKEQSIKIIRDFDK